MKRTKSTSPKTISEVLEQLASYAYWRGENGDKLSKKKVAEHKAQIERIMKDVIGLERGDGNELVRKRDIRAEQRQRLKERLK